MSQCQKQLPHAKMYMVTGLIGCRSDPMTGFYRMAIAELQTQTQEHM
jgi:uncharacterized protein (DUF2237 family)